MDNELVERLIDHVKVHEFLYDLSHRDYKNVSLKAAAWESIGRNLDLTGEAVRNKWKTIRDGYTKHKKQLKSATGPCKKSSYYIWSSHLTFLDDYNTRSNDDTASSPSQSQKKNSEGTASTSKFTRPNQRRHNPSRLQKNTASNNDVRKVIHYLKKKEHDGIDHLFLSYAETFKKFPIREQAIMKIELAKLFSATELQLIKQNETHDNLFVLQEVNKDVREIINVKEENESIME